MKRKVIALLLAASVTLVSPNVVHAEMILFPKQPVTSETERVTVSEAEITTFEEADVGAGNYTLPGEGVHYRAALYERKPDSLTSVSADGRTATVTVKNPNNQIMRRVYNPNSGEHFYTASQAEYDYLASVGWKQEQAAWIAPRISVVPIYRLYNPNAGDHHYTGNESERQNLISLGWKDEGIGWYSSTRALESGSRQIPVYRLYNPNAKTGAHHYTTNDSERKMLIASGWKDEGIGWYADPDEEQNGYEVIEHRGSTDVQSMFYTITTPKGGLIMVDSGWAKDYDVVRRCCEAYDQKVDVWIVTHPHPDHIGGLNGILEKNKNVKIGTIYMPTVNNARYHENARISDEVDKWDLFQQLSRGQNIVRLSENDTIDLLGLGTKVLHSWNETVDRLVDDQCNQGGLILKVNGPTRSMLFCADTGKRIEDEVIYFHGNELQSDYVQCAHHGNWGLSTAFYDKIKPMAVFMDAPDTIIRMAHHGYNGHKLVAYWEKRGVPIYSFRDGDHHVFL